MGLQEGRVLGREHVLGQESDEGQQACEAPAPTSPSGLSSGRNDKAPASSPSHSRTCSQPPKGKEDIPRAGPEDLRHVSGGQAAGAAPPLRLLLTSARAHGGHRRESHRAGPREASWAGRAGQEGTAHGGLSGWGCGPTLPEELQDRVPLLRWSEEAFPAPPRPVWPALLDTRALHQVSQSLELGTEATDHALKGHQKQRPHLLGQVAQADQAEGLRVE